MIKAWYPLIDEEDRADTSRLVVADSGSSDRTHEILMELQKNYPKLQILVDTEKQHGPKVLALYKYAIVQGADYIFQTDSDGQTDSMEFENFWKMIEEYDLIIGNRTARGDGKSRAYVEKSCMFIAQNIFWSKGSGCECTISINEGGHCE